MEKENKKTKENDRIEDSPGGGFVESRRRENSLASTVDDKRISFGDEFLSIVLMHRRINADEQRLRQG